MSAHQEIKRIISDNEFWTLSSREHLNMIDTLHEKMEELDKKIEDLQKENERLKQENKTLQSIVASCTCDEFESG